MNGGDTEYVKRALIAEGVSLLGLLVVLAALGPGRVYGPAAVAWARARMRARDDRIETQVRQFGAEISRWDHEQAAG